QAQKQGSTEWLRLESKVTELQTNRAVLEERMKSLVNVLTVQTDRRATAEQFTNQLAKRQGELEAELAGQIKAQEHLRHELEQAQRQQKAQADNAAAEQSRLEGRQQELAVAYAGAEEQVLRLKKELAVETERREVVRQRAAEHAKCRGELEAALVLN